MSNCCCLTGEYSLACSGGTNSAMRIFLSEPPHAQDLLVTIENSGNCPVIISVNQNPITTVPPPQCESEPYYSSNKNSKTFSLKNVYSLDISCGDCFEIESCCKGSYTICFF
ncbi:hypothetical protein [Crassaminicella profunda]|uniref:hypothetical protein n=1 Tax=Crassaminicella profunda TaxID=1286698 RepID=UPI001CA62791|nr:hypothetical protein [Crassaminicella profunda]QZY57017.1 hypothetical protein K7H06_08895 [Crassaminicella profunda]